MTGIKSPGPHVRFGLRVVLPTVLAICLFVVAIFFVIVPTYERQILDHKREMISELTQSAVSILAEYEREERAGTLGREEAQREAVTRLRFLRYGEEGKDYFWVTDMQPAMVMHPYRPDLEGQDLTGFADPGGKRLFVEMVSRAKADGAGYVEYVWQWKDDPNRIVPKLSHVRSFTPWGWIVGTGIYLEDVRHEIGRLTRHLVRLLLGITGIMTLLLLLILQQSLSIERKRNRAEDSLRESRERYRALVEASTEGIALLLDGRIAFANPTLTEILKRPESEVVGREPSEFFEEREVEPRADSAAETRPAEESTTPPAKEGWILRPDGGRCEVVMTASRATLAGRDATILAVREVSPQAQAQRDREELAVELQVSLQFLQESVKRFLRDPLSCGLNDPIHRAAERMRREETSAILVRADSGEFVGIITDRDMRDRVVAGARSLRAGSPHHELASALLPRERSGGGGAALHARTPYPPPCGPRRVRADRRTTPRPRARRIAAFLASLDHERDPGGPLSRGHSRVTDPSPPSGHGPDRHRQSAAQRQPHPDRRLGYDAGDPAQIGDRGFGPAAGSLRVHRARQRREGRADARDGPGQRHHLSGSAGGCS